MQLYQVSSKLSIVNALTAFIAIVCEGGSTWAKQFKALMEDGRFNGFKDEEKLIATHLEARDLAWLANTAPFNGPNIPTLSIENGIELIYRTCAGTEIKLSGYFQLDQFDSDDACRVEVAGNEASVLRRCLAADLDWDHCSKEEMQKRFAELEVSAPSFDEVAVVESLEDLVPSIM